MDWLLSILPDDMIRVANGRQIVIGIRSAMVKSGQKLLISRHFSLLIGSKSVQNGHRRRSANQHATLFLVKMLKIKGVTFFYLLSSPKPHMLREVTWFFTLVIYFR